ncbi:hypothetical protein ACWAU3_19630 [Shewanella sp. JL219SE-S6]
MDNAARVPEEHFFTTHDGFQLFYRFWPALETNEQEDPGAVLLFHRGHEHGGRMAHLVDELALPEQAFSPGTPVVMGNHRAPEATAPPLVPVFATFRPLWNT